MKNMFTIMAGIVLLAALGGVSRSQATNYPNSVLNGCYGYLLTSQDPLPNDRSGVGTICFDGNGNILAGTNAVPLSGGLNNTNGVISSGSLVAGTYTLSNPNSPGQGMGTFHLTNVTCTPIFAFSVNSVDANQLAHGFQFTLIKKNCTTGPKVIGGTAYLQP
jgi:isoaspartyl peptidase/L-asparaginase-like protein (Ntn-hydrolase superfamily)